MTYKEWRRDVARRRRTRLTRRRMPGVAVTLAAAVSLALLIFNVL